MHSHYINLIFLLLIIIGCSTQNTTNIDLKELQVTGRPNPPRYPFEKFYKTLSIRNIKISNNEKEVYFLKKGRKTTNIFKYSVTDKKMTKVTSYNEPVTNYFLGPQSRYIYIQKDKGGNEIYDIFRFDQKKKLTKKLTKNGGVKPNYLCDLSTDGTKLYFQQAVKMWSFSDVKVIDTKTFKINTLLRSKKDKIWGCGKLSKNERFLSINHFVDNNEIHVGFLDLLKNNINMFQEEKGVKNTNLHFHNNEIYFLSTKDSDIVRVWKYNITNRRPSLVDTKIKGSIESFNIYDNGAITAIKYRGKLNGKLQISKGVFGKKIVLNRPLDKDLKYAVFSKNNYRVGVGAITNSTTPAQYYFIKDKHSHKFYDSNKSAIKNDYFAKSKSILVKSFDGLGVPTHFYIPNNTSKTNKKSAILFIHGGPEAHWDAGYNPIFQYWINRGFIIVTPNVRGSSGFGKKYMFKDNGDWGGGHIKDILAVAEYTKKQKFVDKDNVFLAGGSFGGFSVMSLITQYPKVFKAAICLYGIMEFKSFIGTLPAMAQDYIISELGTDPRKDETFNKKISPLYHIDKIEIPLQIQHGANDSRIPLDQASLIVKSLKTEKKKVDFLVFDDEGHGWSKFKNMKKSFVHLADFIEKFSKK